MGLEQLKEVKEPLYGAAFSFNDAYHLLYFFTNLIKIIAFISFVFLVLYCIRRIRIRIKMRKNKKKIQNNIKKEQSKNSKGTNENVSVTYKGKNVSNTDDKVLKFDKHNNITNNNRQRRK